MNSLLLKPAYGLAMLFLGVLCCTGHALVAFAMKGRPDLQKKNKFLISLAVSDFLVVLRVLVSTWTSFTNEWPIGYIGCQLDASVGMGATFVSLSTVAWIARDKYLRVCRPRKCGEGYTLSLIMVWVAGIIGGIAPFLGFGEYGFETDDKSWQTGCLLTFKTITNKYLFYILFITLFWFVKPMCTIVSSYVKLSQKSPSKLSYIVPIQMCLAFIPYTMYAMASITTGIDALPVYAVSINNLAAKIFISTNPFIYLLTNSELVESLSKIASPTVSNKDEKKTE